jgi:hypothetical protein
MKLRALVIGLAWVALAGAGSAQRISIGIAPVYDAGGDDFGEAVVQHLTLFTYQDLAGTKQFAASLLNPGGVYTPLDTSWLTEYVQDRPDLDLLLMMTLKPTVSTDKGASSTITVEVSLLDARTGDSKSSWTVSDMIKSKNAWLQKGEAMVSGAVNERGSNYGVGIVSSTDFEKQPIGKITAHLAEEVRDSLPAHLGGFVKKVSEKSGDSTEAGSSSAPCEMHTRITYNYKHSVSHSYTLLANSLDESLTIADGVSTFKAPEGPLLLQFTINDAPYKLSKEAIYQLSTMHSCKAPTLVIDIGQGGDAHHHWE